MSASIEPRRVAVLGLGLMGGSLARALKALPDPPAVLGYDALPERTEAALMAGAVDEVKADLEEAVSLAEVVVYATPLKATLDLMARHRRRWRDDALVMDVASLKVPVMSRAGALGVLDRWIGTHPMVGGEGSGFESSRADLFAAGHVWLVGVGGEDAELRARAEAFWQQLGAGVAWTDAKSHDDRMVLASHLPQVLANLLAARLAEEGLAHDELGPGGRDMTRLAGSSPEMWTPLLHVSGDRVGPLLRRLARDQERLADLLESGSFDRVRDLMESTRAWREGAG